MKPDGQRTLAIDVGGTGLKASVLDDQGKMTMEQVRVETPPAPCPPKVIVKALLELVKPLPAYDRVSVGFPGYIRDNKVITAPHFADERWHGFELARELQTKLGKPVRMLNDADMQGLAAIKGKGLELVVTLGTGFGSAMFFNGELLPHMELAHHPIRKRKDYDAFLGNLELKRIGKKRWNERVREVIEILHRVFQYDTLYIGGGNARKISLKLDSNIEIVSNQNGILGGFLLWKKMDEKG